MADFGPIVIICTANICRSPMAEALLRHALKGQPEPLGSLKVVSAGVHARDGDPVSANSVTAMRKVGIDIGNHKSTALDAQMVREALVVLGMTESHRAILQHSMTPVPRNIHLWREFLPQRADKEIGDPFGGPLPLYEACRDEMVEAIPSLLVFLRELTAETK